MGRALAGARGGRVRPAVRRDPRAPRGGRRAPRLPASPWRTGAPSTAGTWSSPWAATRTCPRCSASSPRIASSTAAPTATGSPRWTGPSLTGWSSSRRRAERRPEGCSIAVHDDLPRSRPAIVTRSIGFQAYRDERPVRHRAVLPVVRRPVLRGLVGVPETDAGGDAPHQLLRPHAHGLLERLYHTLYVQRLTGEPRTRVITMTDVIGARLSGGEIVLDLRDRKTGRETPLACDVVLLGTGFERGLPARSPGGWPRRSDADTRSRLNRVRLPRRPRRARRRCAVYLRRRERGDARDRRLPPERDRRAIPRDRQRHPEASAARRGRDEEGRMIDIRRLDRERLVARRRPGPATPPCPGRR